MRNRLPTDSRSALLSGVPGDCSRVLNSARHLAQCDGPENEGRQADAGAEQAHAGPAPCRVKGRGRQCAEPAANGIKQHVAAHDTTVCIGVCVLKIMLWLVT